MINALLASQRTAEFSESRGFSRSLWILFSLSGLCGFFLGAAVYPVWQYAVEGSQVVSGVVSYPAPSPFYMYQTNLWTLLHQIPALFLWLGVPERLLSAILSGVLGMLSFQALALSLFCFSEDLFIALLFPFWVLFTHAADFGVVYMMSLLGVTGTYGVAGLSYIALTLSLIGLGRKGAGFFLLGLAPAVHPGLGVFALAAVFFTRVLNRLLFFNSFQIGRSLIAGLLTSAASFLYHQITLRGLPPIEYREAALYIEAFVRNWCGHRGPVPLDVPGFWVYAASAVMSGVCLAFHKNISSRGFLFIQITFSAAVLAFLLSLVSWIPPQWIPVPLLAAMPARFLNFNTLIFPALLIGVCAGEKKFFPMQILFLGILSVMTKLARYYQFHPDWVAMALIAFLCFFYLFLRLPVKLQLKWQPYAKIPRWAGKAVLGIVMIKMLTLSPLMAAEHRTLLNDSPNAPFWQAVSEDSGMLLTSYDTAMVQLKSRRPVLIDISLLDGLPYAMQSGPLANHLLKELYDGDLLRAPQSVEDSLVPYDQNKASWENRNPEMWKVLAQKFGFSQILTTSEWHLKLPVKAASKEYILYDI